MNEFAWILIPPIGALCFSIGGTGYKWVRRFLGPILIAALLYIFGVPAWQTVVFGGSSAAVFSLGYGDSKNWLVRALVGIVYGLTILSLGPIWVAPLIMLFVFTGQMWLSQRWNWYPWKWVELSTGFAHGSLACWALQVGGWA